MCEIVCTQDDYIAYVDGKSFYGYAYNDFYMSKRDGWEEIQGAEIEKLARYYQIRPGETVTIAIGGTSYVECYTEGDGNGNTYYPEEYQISEDGKQVRGNWCLNLPADDEDAQTFPFVSVLTVDGPITRNGGYCHNHS